MVTVRFYGSLKQFGDTFQLDVRDIAEALRALFSQIKGLRKAISQGFYKIRIGRQYVDNRYLEQGLFYKLKAGMTIHITPVIAGAKKAGVFQVIAGVILTVVGVVSHQYWLAGTGLSLALGGVAQMLTKTPSMKGSDNNGEKKQSTAFGNVQNLVAQGQPVPLAYGRIRCGSMIISQGIETVDVIEQPQGNHESGKQKTFIWGVA